MKMLLVVGALAGASACRDSSGDTTDGAPADAELLAGDFSCRDEAWPTTAADPLAISGKIMDGADELGSVTVEIRDVGDDGLLGTVITSDQAADRGAYTLDLATGGDAANIYRSVVNPGYLDMIV